MSIQALEGFYEKVKSDTALEAEAVNALQEGADALVVLGEREGFEFTAAELAEALAGHLDAGGELSEEDLDLVAGGFIVPSTKLNSKNFGKSFMG